MPAAFPSVHRRVRLAMYLAFAVIGLVAVGSAWMAGETERRRAGDTALIELAASQGAFAERLGRLAWEAADRQSPPARSREALAQALDDSKARALALHGRLEASGAPDVGASFAVWQDARERLWYRAEALLRDDASAATREAAAAAVMAEVGLGAEAADRLVQALRRAAQERGEVAVGWAHAAGVLILLTLAVLAVAVVEPAVRAVRRQHRRLSDQAAELERLALVAERTDNAVIVADARRRIAWVNEAFIRMTGYGLDEAIGRSPADLLLSPLADRAVEARLREALDRGEAVRAQLMHRAKDGRDYWVDTDIQPLFGPEGGSTGFIAVETDITTEVTERLKTAALLAALPDAVLVYAPDGVLVDANPAAEQLLELSRDELLGRLASDGPWRAIRDDLSEYAEADRPVMRTLRDACGLRGEVMGVHRPSGDLRWLHVNTEPLRDAMGQPAGAVVCLVDITERRRLQDSLTLTARTDALTGLPNRAVVMERIQRALEHRRTHPGYGFAVLFMDFDRFKQVNDTHGHGVGDELLRQIAHRLVTALRPGDAVARVGSEMRTAARIGGDEFVVVLEGVHDTARVQAVVERLLEELTEPYALEALTLQSSASIGVVVEPLPDATADSVLRDADTAMYEAKRAGRGRFMVFDPSMHDRVARALSVETDLRRALRSRELHVVYQPLVGLDDGQVRSVEALVRWRHPERGLVPPAEFIPVAEDAGLIGEVGDFVLDAACRQLAQWQHTLGPQAPASVAVNVSRAQLRQPGLVERVQAVLASAGIEPGELQLEVTESLAAQDGVVKATLAELRALGVRLALDDFGTGYSSLACLHEMPVHTVKIDRSFVVDAEHSAYHRVVIEATLRVAATLGMSSVAEGIETRGQALLMADLGCRVGQGYLFSRPLEAHALTGWLGAEPPRVPPSPDPSGRQATSDA